VGRKVVMDEELTAHEEERHVMDGPDEEKEACIIPQAVTYSCRKGKLVFRKSD
jgi:hypothetical protein